MSKNGFGFHSRPICLLDQPSNDKPAVSFVLYRGAVNDKKVAEFADCESDFWGDYMTNAAAVISVTAAVKVPPHGPEDWREFWESVKSDVDAQLTNSASQIPAPKTS